MKKNILHCLLAVFAVFAVNVATADHDYIITPESETRAPEVRYRGPYLTTYIAAGIGSGGDVMGRFTDNRGDTERVRSGGGLNFEGGVLAALDRSTMLRLTAGYESDWADRANGHAAFDRARFDLMFLRNFGSSEFGVGLTAHTGVGYRCDINSICAGDVDFDNAVGYTLEYALSTMNVAEDRLGTRVNRRLHPLRSARIGLRFTDIEYTPKFGELVAADEQVVDGKSLSLFVGMAF